VNIEEYISSGIIESYVLGLADAQEVAELEQLKGAHPEIQAAIDSFEASLETAAFANTITPAADTKDKLMLALQDEFVDQTNILNQQTKEVKVVTMPLKPIPAKSAKMFQYIAAASIILFVVSAALNVYFFREYTSANKQVVALLNEKNALFTDNNNIQAKYQEITNSLQLMSNTNVIKVAMKGIAGKEGNLATVFWNSKSKDVYVLANKLPKAPEGKQYQLWALVKGKPIDAGMLNDCNGVCKLKNTQQADLFAITLEKKGGSPSPDLTQLYVLGKVSS
jgi:anti-sigma-K factor RskA